jgi:hypothetical protein
VILKATSFLKGHKSDKRMTYRITRAHHMAHWAAARLFSGRIPTYPSYVPSITNVGGKNPPPLFWQEALST